MPFAFRRQPLTTFYLLFSALVFLFVRLPVWTIVSVFPAGRPRRSWSVTRSITVRALQAAVSLMYDVGFPVQPNPGDIPKTKKDPYIVSVKALPSELIVGDVAAAMKHNNVTSAAVCGYWSGSDGKVLQQSPTKASDGEKVLYMLHGGGHVSGSGDPKLDSAPVAPSIIQKANGTISRVFSVEYRLCSAAPFSAANPFPANLIDTIAGYHYLIHDMDFRPENIVVAGVSSGGHLAADLVLYLVQSKLSSLPIPGAVLLLSPTLDWARTHDKGPQCSMMRNRAADIVDPILMSGYPARALLGSLPERDLSTNPYLSPASLDLPNPQGLFTGFPPTCIVAGDAEQTLDPMHTFYDRLVADNGEDRVRCLEYHDANHTFLTLSVFEPERTRAYQDIKQWLEENMNAAS